MINFNNGTLRVQGHWLYPEGAPKPLPTLPEFSLRLKYNDGVIPTLIDNKGTLIQRSTSPNIWDWTYEDYNWNGTSVYYPNLQVWGKSIVPNMSTTDTLNPQDTVIEVLEGNTTGVRRMEYVFAANFNITTIPVIDTSKVTTMANMFMDCESLNSLPLLDTSKVESFSGILGCSYYGSSGYTYPHANKLTSLPNWDGSSCEYMQAAFAHCLSITDADSIQRWYNQFKALGLTPQEDSGPFAFCGYTIDYSTVPSSNIYNNQQVETVITNIAADNRYWIDS